MIYHGESPHPCHQGFAEAIGADQIGLDEFSVGYADGTIPTEVVNGLLLNQYDVYVSEGTRPLYGTLAKASMNSSTVVYLAADAELYKLLDSGYELSGLNRIIGSYGISAIGALFDRYIDGVIAVSDWTASYVRNVVQKPTRIAHPYVQPGLFDELKAANPDLDKNVAVTVGSYEMYKGQDLLVEAWPNVRRKHPDAELRLVGRGYPNQFEAVEGVSVQGYVDNLAAELSKASLYVQPSRADSFPVSVLEGLLTGLPAVVTETTGTKSEVTEISDTFVVETDAEGLAAGINRYFSMDTERRQKMSKTAQRHGEQFDAKSCKQDFETKFYNLLSYIQ